MITKTTAQKKQETSVLKKRATYFNWMLDEYIGNVYVADMETYELLYLNKAACDTLGMSPEKIIGKKCYEVIQGRTSPCPFCTNKKLKENAFYEWEFYNAALKRTFLIKNRIIDWNGHRARLELSHDNYSLEYKLEKKDREKNAIMRTIPGGLTRINANDMMTVLWHGAGFLELIGYTKEQFEKELHSQWTCVHPEDMNRMINTMKSIQKTNKNAIIECRIITRSRKIKNLTVTLSYVSGEASWDGIPSFYSIGIDVTKERTEQERQRRALEDAYAAAKVANSAKTNFLSSMSHDIRTPMNAIVGMAAIAKANLKSPEKINDCLDKINTSSHHLLNLINEVLDMSKIESGKIDLVLETISLSDLIQNVVDMCRPLIKAKHQELAININHVKHETVITDGDRLQQVLINLITNSIKYTPEEGKISLQMNELYSPVTNENQYEFVLTDNGIGMSKEFLKHIFEPFSRAEDSRINKIQGTGLGMAITENIVHMMNGTIDVQSELGVGSRFLVSLPLQIDETDTEDENELLGLPVLIVDDDIMVCENGTSILEELGMRGYYVLSGEEAVDNVLAAHENKDDYFAVIIDWKMPTMDGLSTIQQIRKKLGLNVPIIVLSAYDFSDIADDFLSAGADAFITKPLFKSKILHVLKPFCAKNNAEDKMADNLGNLSNRHLKLLLADDNELNRQIIVELLQMQGIYVDAVENGEEAVEAFKNNPVGHYSAILMDIQMPVLNGYEATQRIRNSNKADAKDIPIIALTANAFASDIERAHHYGMNEHLAKPIDVKVLLRVLQKWIK